MQSDCLEIVSPGEGDVLPRHTKFGVYTSYQGPWNSGEFFLVFEFKHPRASQFSRCDDSTMIQNGDKNPVPMDLTPSWIKGILRTTAITGEFQLRVRILDKVDTVLYVSKPVRITVEEKQREAYQGRTPNTQESH